MGGPDLRTETALKDSPPPAGPQYSGPRGWLVIRLAYLEPETDPGGGSEGVVVQEPRSKPVLDLGVHGAEVPVEALGEPVVEHDRSGVLGARAVSGDVAGTAGVGSGREGVLLVAVVGGREVHLVPQRELHPGPEHLQDLRVGEGFVVDDAQHVATDRERARGERVVRVLE